MVDEKNVLNLLNRQHKGKYNNRLSQKILGKWKNQQ